jgi:hypothetical protein
VRGENRRCSTRSKPNQRTNNTGPSRRHQKQPIPTPHDTTEHPRGSGATVAHLLCKQGVEGSNPFFSTQEIPTQDSPANGDVAQLVAHLHGMEGVRGSSPLVSTQVLTLPNGQCQHQYGTGCQARLADRYSPYPPVTAAPGGLTSAAAMKRTNPDEAATARSAPEVCDTWTQAGCAREPRSTQHSGVPQLAEESAHNRNVASSILAPATQHSTRNKIRNTSKRTMGVWRSGSALPLQGRCRGFDPLHAHRENHHLQRLPLARVGLLKILRCHSPAGWRVVAPGPERRMGPVAAQRRTVQVSRPCNGETNVTGQDRGDGPLALNNAGQASACRLPE